MKKRLQIFKLVTGVIIFSFLSVQSHAQTTLEWRLGEVNYNATDPDGTGPATGSVTFTLQIHSTTSAVPGVNVIATGYSYQSTKAIIPSGAAGPGCPLVDEAPVNEPANVQLSPAFIAAGFKYNTVKQCSTLVQTSGTNTFDRRAVGTLEGNGITITPEWMDVFTVTLWSINQVTPEAGFVVINSASGGSPGEFPTYSVSDAAANEYPVNSLTFASPLLLPISLSAFDVACTNKGAKLDWQTLSEQNNSFFEIERSNDGVNGWKPTGTLNAAGNSNGGKHYNFVDLQGGTTYYRLKQVDKDGTFTYSNIKKANCATNQLSLLVYPIPAKNILNVVVGADKTSKATIQLVDVTGKLVRQLNTDLLKGNNNLKLNVSGLARGEYFLRVLGMERLRTHKVTIN